MDEVDDEELNAEEAKERKILRMLLKIKNGTPPQRKTALRQITDKARDFGAGPLFNQILPLLMSPTLEDQERHLLVKVCSKSVCVCVCFLCVGSFAVDGVPGGLEVEVVVPLPFFFARKFKNENLADGR